MKSQWHYILADAGHRLQREKLCEQGCLNQLGERLRRDQVLIEYNSKLLLNLQKNKPLLQCDFLSTMVWYHNQDFSSIQTKTGAKDHTFRQVEAFPHRFHEYPQQNLHPPLKDPKSPELAYNRRCHCLL